MRDTPTDTPSTPAAPTPTWVKAFAAGMFPDTFRNLLAPAAPTRAPCRRTTHETTMTDDTPPAPPGLTPTQAMRWRDAARTLAQAARTDVNALDRGNRTLLVGRLRHAAADMMALVAEACAQEDAHRSH